MPGRTGFAVRLIVESLAHKAEKEVAMMGMLLAVKPSTLGSLLPIQTPASHLAQVLTTNFIVKAIKHKNSRMGHLVCLGMQCPRLRNDWKHGAAKSLHQWRCA